MVKMTRKEMRRRTRAAVKRAGENHFHLNKPSTGPVRLALKKQESESAPITAESATEPTYAASFRGFRAGNPGVWVD